MWYATTNDDDDDDNNDYYHHSCDNIDTVTMITIIVMMIAISIQWLNIQTDMVTLIST